MSTVPAKVISQYVNEGCGYEYDFTYGSSLIGSTITFLAKEESASGSGVVVATATGASADVSQSVTLTYGSLATGNYLVEVWKDVGSTGELMLYPPENVKYRISIQERFGT